MPRPQSALLLSGAGNDVATDYLALFGGTFSRCFFSRVAAAA
jgi:hypothetical protein